MKKLILFLTISLIFSMKGYSQIDSTVHEETRRLILNLNRANCQSNFLFDLAGHGSNDTFYKIRSYDTSNTLNWFTIYDEMYFMAYNLGFIPDVQPIYEQVQNIINKEEIIPSLGTYKTHKVPLGLMDFEFNSIRPDAFDSANLGTWFFWNDDSIWDNPNRSTEPFEVNTETPGRGTCKEIFAFSPLSESSYFRNVTFTIDPSQFIFYGNQYSLNTLAHPTPHLLEINFEDGAGWRSVNPYVYSEIAVTYPIEGVYYPKARVSVDGILIKHSLSTFTVESNELIKLPDFVKWLPHLNVGVYKGCSNDSLLKPIIYLEGIDPQENRHIPEIYSQMILATKARGLLPMLLNYDYDFVVVSWKNSTQDMKVNASAVVGLLDWLKTVTDTTHQFIMIGESMGGVVGRYALTYMETPAYTNNINNQSKPWREHNTRLFISLDAPHQGAVIPLALQHVNDWLYTVPYPVIRSSFFFLSAFWKNQLYKNLLKQDAVKQLLVLHRDTRSLSGGYTEHSKRTDFMNDLVNLNPTTGGYPSHCKLMAMSNGLIAGDGQVGYRDRIILPNDLMADVNMFIGVKIFKVIPIPLFAVDKFELRINPAGNGDVVDIGWRFNLIGAFKFRGCLTNIFKRKSSPCNILGVGLPFKVNVSNTLAWETFPGGTQYALGRLMHPDKNHSAKKWYYKTLTDYDDYNGTITLKRSYGVRFLATNNFNFNLSADVDDWCFVPLQSALDYKGYDNFGYILPQNHNIIINNVGTNMGRTPFHIIMGWNTDINLGGYPSTKGTTYANGLAPYNKNHVAFRNDPIGQYPLSIGPIDHGIINREIGDVHLYLDNMNINREAFYQCDSNIFAGYNQHPHYFYNGIVGDIEGLHADNQKYVIDSFDIGEVVFKAGHEIRLRDGFESLRASNFRATIDSMFRCHYTLEELQNIAAVPQLAPLKVNPQPTKEVIDLILFPNPTCNNLSWKANETINAAYVIFDTKGAVVMEGDLKTQSGEFKLEQIALGTYFIKISDGIFIKYYKFVKQ